MIWGGTPALRMASSISAFNLASPMGVGSSLSGSKMRGSLGPGSRPNLARNAARCSANASRIIWGSGSFLGFFLPRLFGMAHLLGGHRSTTTPIPWSAGSSANQEGDGELGTQEIVSVVLRAGGHGKDARKALGQRVRANLAYLVRRGRATKSLKRTSRSMEPLCTLTQLDGRQGRSLGEDMPLEDHAQHWRNCAAEARSLASQMKTDEARHRMLEVAADYLRMAQLAEDQTARGKAPSDS